MLLKNVWQSKGLYNGALGTVRAVLYMDGQQHEGLPRAILVEFADYIGPSIVPEQNIVPIVLKTITFDPRCGKTGKMKQFPMELGWAVTIHKSQGLTLDRVMIDIGERERFVGTTYVTCSRVRSIANLAFEKSFPFDRLRRLNDSLSLQEITREIRRLEGLAQNLL